MNDEHGFPIQWNPTNANHGTPAWAGPAPDAAREDVAAASNEGYPGTNAGERNSMSDAWSASAPAAAAGGSSQVAPEQHAWHEQQPQAGYPSSAPSHSAAQDFAPQEQNVADGQSQHVGYPHDAAQPQSFGSQPPVSTGYPSAPQNPEHGHEGNVGWAGHPDTAGNLSQNSANDSGYGWSASQSGPAFAAPDAPAQAPGQYTGASSSQDLYAPHSGQGNQDLYSSNAGQGNYATSSPQGAPAYSTDPNASNNNAFASAPPSAEPSAFAAQPQAQPSAAAAAPEVVANNDNLPEDSLTIGRSRDNGIVLDDMLVSRRHVVITADDDGLLLRDVGSRNGTFVNGRRVEQTHLHEGDRIGIGASTFEVRDGWLVSV